MFPVKYGPYLGRFSHLALLVITTFAILFALIEFDSIIVMHKWHVYLNEWVSICHWDPAKVKQSSALSWYISHRNLITFDGPVIILFATYFAIGFRVRVKMKGLHAPDVLRVRMIMMILLTRF